MDISLQAPNRLTITLRDKRGARLSDLFVSLQAKTDYKNHFWFLFGPSSLDGVIRIEWADILRRADETASFALMDYGRFDRSFTGQLVLSLAEQDRVRRAINAYSKNKEHFSFPSGYVAALERSLVALDRGTPAEVVCDIEFNPPANRLAIDLMPPIVAGSEL